MLPSKFNAKRIEKFLVDKNRKLKVLIIRDGLLGDIVFITPVLERLTKTFPNISIDLVLGYKAADIVKNFPGIKNIFTTPKSFNILAHVKLFLSLRKNRYDIIFVQEVNTHYAIMSRLTGAKFVFGYKHQLDFLFSLSVQRHGHAVKAEQQLLDMILPAEYIAPVLYVSEDERKGADKFFAENNIREDKPIVCFQFACSEENSIRLMAPQKLAELADNLIEKYNAQIIFTGVASELIEIEEVKKLMKNTGVLAAGKTTVRELIAILEKASLVIGPDTGTLHVADALNIPVIMFMGYADKNDTGPSGKNSLTTVITAGLDCIPCKYKNPKPANWQYCSVNRPAKCMDMITVAELEQAAVRILG